QDNVLENVGARFSGDVVEVVQFMYGVCTSANFFPWLILPSISGGPLQKNMAIFLRFVTREFTFKQAIAELRHFSSSDVREESCRFETPSDAQRTVVMMARLASRKERTEMLLTPTYHLLRLLTTT